MWPRRNSAHLRALAAIVFCACVSSCAVPVAPADGIASAREAQAAVTIGKSTKADVAAMFGKAVVVAFDSGYEVWVYRERAARAGLLAQPDKEKEQAEFVLLFAPSGVVQKTRVRMPSA